jgi:hypothetical protein
LAALVAAGCGGAQNVDQRIDRALREAGTLRVAVFPLSGKVTVDGEPPSGTGVALVMLSDPAKLDVPLAQRRFAHCESDGRFIFTTYKYGDGIPEGDYVVTLAQLSENGSLNSRGPDGFRNLYSDPRTSEFKIEHRPPGRTDYTLELHIEGR